MARKKNLNMAKLIEKHLALARKGKEGRVFMFQVPEERYFDVNLETVKVIVNNMGYNGLYISLHRPYGSLISSLRSKGIKTEKVYVVDAASSQASAAEMPSEKCVFISSDLKIDELTRAVYTMLSNVSDRNTFLFLDSITTIALYQPLSETLRFAEFLMRTLDKAELKGLVINVAKDLAQKRFIQDIALKADDVIKINGEANGD